MLYALRQPAVLLGLVLGFAAGCFLRATLQRLAKGGLRPAGTRRLTGATAPRNWLDPFGTVAAVLGGAGWSPRPELGFRSARRQVWIMVGIAFLVHAVLAIAGIAAYVALGGHRAYLGIPHFPTTLAVLHGSVLATALAPSILERIALGFGIVNLVCGLLVLLPLPPLELGVALWTVLPRSAGARQWAYRLLEEQWGIAIVLLLLVVPLGGTPLLLRFLCWISDMILNAVSGT
jgi:hypothetical protein